LLAAAELTPSQRDTIEQAELAYARRVARGNSLQGAEILARLVPYLSPRRQHVAHRAAGPVLAEAERLIMWRAPMHTTPLRYRKLWRVLAPEEYPAWLARHCARLLDRSLWSGSPALFRENLAHVHLLHQDDARRAAETALEAVTMLSDDFITEDREFGLGGASYTAGQVAAAARAAQAEALRAIAPILAPELHDRAHEQAAARGIAQLAGLGAQLADATMMRGTLWYHMLPDDPIPWLTVSERQPAFAALQAPERAQLVATFVDAAVREAMVFLEDLPRRGVTGDTVARRWGQLVDEDLPIAARYLDAKQTLRLLALWQLPDTAAPSPRAKVEVPTIIKAPGTTSTASVSEARTDPRQSARAAAPEVAASIQRHIDALQPRLPGDWPVRVCKEDLNALPLHSNQLFLWAIQPDGKVLCLDHEAFAHPVEPVTDLLVRYAVLAHGARRYPELATLIPEPPRGAQPCGRCAGSGQHITDTGALQSCLACGGLGWSIGPLGQP
jgi:hypothetical protein